MTELELIRTELECLSNLKYASPFILEFQVYEKINKQSLLNNNSIIGEKTGKFTHENYDEMYREIKKNGNWQLKLLDDSLISFYYCFDNQGNVIKYSLSYIPCINEDSLAGLPSKSDRYETLLPCFMNYIRIDFDETGYEKRVHELQHMHKGLNSRNKKHGQDESYLGQSDLETYINEIRLPVKRVFFPNDFVQFILEYVYHESIDIVNLNPCNKKRIIIDEESQNFSIDNNY
ncbi:Uncharacterised protein [Streptococcus salivarius]|nr:Uncharacterised protein [Streptococcus salivarius]VUW85231.1 Uncharacterised protein [Streptococcus thermophilus]